MKHHFIRCNQTEVLELIFAGWGMDYNLFIKEKGENDLCICYDYTDLTFDSSVLKTYKEIRLIAWSFGVWVAATILSHQNLPISRSIAINGTLFPVNEEKGISPTIFTGTLRGLSSKTIEKFNRRMCGTKENKLLFDSNSTERTFESIEGELRALSMHFNNYPIPAFQYNTAVIGDRDLIFLPEKQLEGWKNQSVHLLKEPNMFHYPVHFLKYLFICRL